MIIKSEEKLFLQEKCFYAEYCIFYNSLKNSREKNIVKNGSSFWHVQKIF